MIVTFLLMFWESANRICRWLWNDDKLYSVLFRIRLLKQYEKNQPLEMVWIIWKELKRRILEEDNFLGLLEEIIRELKQRRRRRLRRRQVKIKFIFYQRYLRLSRSVRYANGAKIVLKLNMQRRRSIPNGKTKN